MDNRFDRIHHSVEPHHFDRNFGICFTPWDRLFGTAYDPLPGEWPKVRIQDAPAPRDLGDFLLMPFRIFRSRLGEARKQEPEIGEGEAICLSCGSSSQPN